MELVQWPPLAQSWPGASLGGGCKRRRHQDCPLGRLHLRGRTARSDTEHAVQLRLERWQLLHEAYLLLDGQRRGQAKHSAEERGTQTWRWTVLTPTSLSKSIAEVFRCPKRVGNASPSRKLGLHRNRRNIPNTPFEARLERNRSKITVKLVLNVRIKVDASQGQSWLQQQAIPKVGTVCCHKTKWVSKITAVD